MSNCQNCKICSGWKCNPGKSYVNQSAKAPSLYGRTPTAKNYAFQKSAYTTQPSSYQTSYSASPNRDYQAVNYQRKEQESSYGGN